MENLMELIKRRRSVRIFSGKEVSKEDILSIIEAGTWAPTGCNNQELKFLILDKKKEVEEILKFKPFFKGASAFVLVFCDMSLPMSKKMYIEYKYERHLPYIDTGLALQNMILHAKDRGIDSCVFNLSEYHFTRDGKKRNIFQKIINKIKTSLGSHTKMEGNFEYYLRNNLKIPNYLKIMCGVAFGYAKICPNVNKEIHGGKKVMRDKVENYIISKK